jgi:hypothetical protein
MDQVFKGTKAVKDMSTRVFQCAEAELLNRLVYNDLHDAYHLFANGLKDTLKLGVLSETPFVLPKCCYAKVMHKEGGMKPKK